MGEKKFSGVQGYDATEGGSIVSTSSNWRGYGAREMRQHLSKDGYLRVRLTVDGRRKWHSVHRLVCRAFHGEQPSPNHEVRHIDGSRDNNRASNLAWGTKSENACDRVTHGTQYRPPWDDPSFRKAQMKRMRAAHKRNKENGVGRYAR